MKKHILLYSLFQLILFSSYGQTWEWVKNHTYGAQAYGTSIGCDSQNNIYVTGFTEYFTGGGGSYYYEILWKLDSTGNLLWSDTLDMIETKSVIDSTDNIYIAGNNIIAKYESSGANIWTVIVPIAGYFQNIALHPSGGVIVAGGAIFGNESKGIISRYDSSGNCLWTKVGDFPSGGNTPFAISCDQTGNIYIAGAGDVVAIGYNFGFLVKYDSNGNLLYSRNIPHIPNDITIDKENNIYITGWYGNHYPVNINGTIYYSGNSLFHNQYLIKYDQAGNILWYRLFKKIYDVSIDTDKKGNVYLTAQYSFGSEIDSINLSSAGIIVMKIESSGNIAWYLKSNSVSTSGTCSPRDIRINVNNEIFITGAVGGIQAFGPDTIISGLSYSDLLVAKIRQQDSMSDATLNVLTVNFNSNQTQLCLRDSITFTDSSTGNITNWIWFFEGGTPETSTAQNPTIVYTQPGNFFVKLVVCDSATSDSLLINNYITVNALPVVTLGADTFLAAGANLVLDAANPGSQYLWSNGNTGQTIEVSSGGNYSVTITDQNGCVCTGQIYVSFSPTNTDAGSVSSIIQNSFLSVYPNPTKSNFAIECTSSIKADLLVSVKNESCQTIYSEKKKDFTGEYNNTINLSRQPPGIYFIEVICGEERRVKKIVIE